MSENQFTKDNHDNGIPSQVILDAGLNVFALKLLIESFTKMADRSTEKLEFTHLGVDISLKITDKIKD